MIGTETNAEYLKELEEFEKYKATLRQEPDGDVKKRSVSYTHLRAHET